jgi:hypothetical protein
MVLWPAAWPPANRHRRSMLAFATRSSALAGLQLPGLMNSLDFLNVMTYDYHGGWERQVNFLHPWNDTLVSMGCGAGAEGMGGTVACATGNTPDATVRQRASCLCPTGAHCITFTAVACLCRGARWILSRPCGTI